MFTNEPSKLFAEAIELEETYGTPGIGNIVKSHDTEKILNTYKLYEESQSIGLFEEYCDRLGNDFNQFGYDFINSFQYLNDNTSNVLFRSSSSDSKHWNEAMPFQLWLSVITNKAQKIESNVTEKFDKIDQEFITRIAHMSTDIQNIRSVRKELLKKGVIIVYEPSLGTLKTDAAVTLLPSGNPVIGMTLRYKRLDYFWFTLLHELSHIALHLNELNGYIADDFEDQDMSSSIIERQADRLALECIVPRTHWRRTTASKRQDLDSVIDTANTFNVHPALIAGRLRKETGNYSKFSDIVNEYDVREILGV